MPVPDDILRALGRVVVNFAAVEMHLTFLTGELITQDQPVAQIVSSEMNFKTLRAALKSIVHAKLPQDKAVLDRLDDLLGQAKHAEDLRNQLMHCFWLDDGQGGMGRFKMTAKEDKGLKHTTAPITAKDINDVADKLKKVGEDIGRFIGELSKKLPMHVSDGPPPKPPQ